MATDRVHNFTAGPSALPLEVLERIRDDLIDFQGTGRSILEHSHRGVDFIAVAKEAEHNLRELMNIPEDYSVLFLQGGASLLFSTIPMNILGNYAEAKSVKYIVTGTWSKKAAAEAKKYCPNMRVVWNGEEGNFSTLPNEPLRLGNGETAYTWCCMNETVHGVEFKSLEQVIAKEDLPSANVVVDMSSCFLSRPFDVSQCMVCMAGAQKNSGIAGVTILIVRKDSLDKAMKICPTSQNWKVVSDANSMYNTPPVFAIYVAGLVFKWIKKQGGLKAMEAMNAEKAALLYNFLDNSAIYRPIVSTEARSRMNCVFRIVNPSSKERPEFSAELEKKFVHAAAEHKLVGLAGHRSVGGLRVSLYNAISLQSVKELVKFMTEFEREVISSQ